MSIKVTSPLEARQNTPIFLYLLIILAILASIIVIGLFIKKFLDYRKSQPFIEKEKERLTKHKDIEKLKKECNLSNEEAKLLFYYANIMQCKNLYYLLRNNQNLQDFFRDTYHYLRELETAETLINDFFKLSYKLENHFAQTKTIVSTRQIPLSSVVFYMTKEGEQFPFYVYKNEKESLMLEIPQFFYEKSDRPEELEKLPFSFKTNNGLNYTFPSRVIRYQKTPGEKNLYLMVVAHTESLSVEVQRHYKRETIECDAMFAPVRISKNSRTNQDIFVHSNNNYKGKMINISGGGCCIKTNLPIRENQNIGITIPSINIKTPLVGVIKKTRRLSDGAFALHIQFLQYSMEDQNKILAFVYKYDL